VQRRQPGRGDGGQERVAQRRPEPGEQRHAQPVVEAVADAEQADRAHRHRHGEADDQALQKNHEGKQLQVGNPGVAEASGLNLLR